VSGIRKGGLEVRRSHADRIVLLKLCRRPAAVAKPGHSGGTALLDHDGALVGLGAVGADAADAWRSLLAAVLNAPDEVMAAFDRELRVW
jgi:hypothetical protein